MHQDLARQFGTQREPPNRAGQDELAARPPIRAAIGIPAPHDRGVAHRARSEIARINRFFRGVPQNLPRIIGHLRHERLRIILPPLDLLEPKFPVAGQLGRFQTLVPHQRNQPPSEFGADQVLLFPFHIVALDQNLDNRGPRGRSPHPLVLEGLLQRLVGHVFAGRLHQLQQRGLVEALGGGCFERLERGFVRIGFALAEIGHLLRRLPRFGRRRRAIQPTPAGIDQHFAPGPEGNLPGQRLHHRHGLDAGWIKHRDQAQDHRIVKPAFIAPQPPPQHLGGQDGMVVGHFFIVNDPGVEGQGSQVERSNFIWFKRPQSLQQWRDGRFNVVIDVAAIGSRIGEMFVLVESLGQPQGLVGGEAIHPVHVLLQRGQIIELGRVGILFFLGHRLHHQGMRPGRLHHRLPLRRLLEFALGMLERRPTAHGVHFPEILRLEILDLQIPIDNHGQNRGLHPPDAEQQIALPVFQSKKTGGIEADDPIRLAPTFGRMVEPVKLGRRGQVGKSLLDCRMGQRTDPQPAARLRLAPGPSQDVAEDQLSFPPGIRGADDFVRRLEEALNGLQLIRRRALLAGAQLKGGRNHRQVAQTPRLPLRPVFLRLLQLHHVAKGPGHGPTAALEPAIPAGIGPQVFGQITGHGWFFSKDDLHTEGFRRNKGGKPADLPTTDAQGTTIPNTIGEARISTATPTHPRTRLRLPR